MPRKTGGWLKANRVAGEYRLVRLEGREAFELLPLPVGRIRRVVIHCFSLYWTLDERWDIGMERPEVRTPVRLPESLLAAIDRVAERTRTNRSWVIREALYAYLSSEIDEHETVVPPPPAQQRAARTTARQKK